MNEADTEYAARPRQALEHCIERLETIIEAETRLLRRGGRLDFGTLNARKTHALLEFIQASKGAQPSEMRAVAARAKRLQDLLVTNTGALERHLQATQEINTLIVASIRKDESDGTYSIQRPGAR